MKIEFPSHFPHGLCRVQDIAISDLAPNALPTATRLSCRSCRQPGTAECAHWICGDPLPCYSMSEGQWSAAEA